LKDDEAKDSQDDTKDDAKDSGDDTQSNDSYGPAALFPGSRRLLRRETTTSSIEITAVCVPDNSIVPLESEKEEEQAAEKKGDQYVKGRTSEAALDDDALTDLAGDDGHNPIRFMDYNELRKRPAAAMNKPRAAMQTNSCRSFL